jgi:hypothetical protein
LSFTYASPISPCRSIALTVQPYSMMAYGIETPNGATTWYGGQTAASGNSDFEFWQSADPTEIDVGGFDSATVTALQLPAQDGDPLTMRFQVRFVDGRVLDETFSSQLVTHPVSCGAG